MTLCINPSCQNPNHPENAVHSTCQSCGSELILQGRYRVMRLLTNSSGFGIVYEAFERDQPKILKVLKPLYSSTPKAVQLFEQEALVLSRLHHPGVPRVESDGCFQVMPKGGTTPLHCIVMEKIDGPNLSEWMRQQGNHPIQERQAIQWLQQLAEVLHLVHQQQYFHRDIKPENIMLRSDGQLVLVDFGAAREMTYTYFEQLESTGGITRISSAGYTAPEQERGQAVPQSDFYALGCTFIYLLTGKRPVDASIYDVQMNELNWRPLAPHISPGFANFIDRLTASRVMDRPINTLEILTQLGGLQDAIAPSASGAAFPSTHPDHPSFSNGAGASGAGKENGTGPGGTKGDRPSLSLSPDASSGADSNLVEEIPLFTLPPDYTAMTGVERWSRPSQSVPVSDTTQPPGASDLLPAAFSVSPPSQTGALAPDTLMQSSQTTLQSQQGSGKGRTLRWLGVGMLLLGLVGGGIVGGRSLHLLHSQQSQESVEPDALAFSLPTVLEGHTSAVNALAMSVDQRTLVSGSDDKTVRIWDLVAGQELRSLIGHGDRVQAIAISPNGRLVASGDGESLIKLWDLMTGEAIADLAGHTGAINALAITADGRTLVSASADRTIKLWNLVNQTEIATLRGHNSFVNTVDISPDGTVLASGSADRTVKLWNLTTQQEIATLTDHTSFVNTVTFSLDGTYVISGGADSQINIWDRSTYRPVSTLEHHDSFVNALSMTLDGQFLISTSADQTIAVWDLNARNYLQSIAWPNTFVNAAVVRATGSTWQVIAAGRGNNNIHIWNVE